MILMDWQERAYEVEIAYVRFLGGYVAWIDDEPYDDNVFPSKSSALGAVREHLGSA